MDVCVLCKEAIDNGKSTVKIGEKGSQGINNASQKRGDSIITSAGDTVHQHCRRSYCNPKAINSKQHETKQNVEVPPVLRSSNSFQFSEDCLFCGQRAEKCEKYKEKKDVIFQVRTKDFQRNIEELCKQRSDDWSVQVLGRLEFARDLHAADAVYHQSCSVNFRTLKTMPKSFSPRPDKSAKSESRGRPRVLDEAYGKVMEYLRNNDDEQITVLDLVNKMKEFTGGDTCSTVYMKKRILDHFGDQVVITEIQGTSNVVTFRSTAKSILQNFFKRNKSNDPETEKNEIILTAAKLIKNDIKSLDATKLCYPKSSDLASREKNVEYVPNCLQLFLRSIFSEKDSTLKIASIGQSIMQATRPRTTICPMQIGLGVQLHHHFSSKFLLDTLYNLGFSSSYSEVLNFESSAAIAQGTDIVGFDKQHHALQFVADNVDHNIRTIDGFNTFHGMGIIAGMTPGSDACHQVARISVTSEDLIAAGKIEIKFYNLPPTNMETPSMKYSEIKDLKLKDPTWKFDLLCQVMWPLKSPMPVWSGLMQTFQAGDYPGESSVTFFPMIDIDPSDLTCIYSTLNFVQAIAERYNTNTVITFDQPLYWNALSIVSSEPTDSHLKNIVVRLGGFHTIMSFLGSIGHLMAGAGMQEVLENVYASNAVNHMMSGKAVERAVRGHLLVDRALQSLILADVLDIQLPVVQADPGDDQIEIELPDTDHDATDNLKVPDDETVDTPINLLTAAEHLYNDLLDNKTSVHNICQSDILDDLQHTLAEAKTKIKSSRTGKLWLQYCEMIGVLKQFIKAERTGDWSLHLQSLYSMLPYFAASGHNLYTKCGYIYLSQMQKLPETHPDIYDSFQKGHHVLRRSDRFWGGLSTDLIIEQVLMRSVKTSGGMTRGRGMEEAQRAQWLLSMPIRAEYNNAMQNLTDAGYHTSEQHKATMTSRKLRDNNDTISILTFLHERSLFIENQVLRNIATGLVADKAVNVDDALVVGRKIIQSMEGMEVQKFVFKKSNQVVTFNSKVNSKSDDDATVSFDPQVLFQRLTALGNMLNNDVGDMFRYELSTFPSSLFEPSGMLREANKPALADSIWNIGDCSYDQLLQPKDFHFVLDGGSLLQKLPWSLNTTFGSICQTYVNYVTKRYEHTVVVFDGYPDRPSTKDVTHMRRTKGIAGPEINFTDNMPCKSKKEIFLSNTKNKQTFISMLGIKLSANGVKVVHSKSDADLDIAKTAVACAESHDVVVMGEDTDLLVLLLHHASILFKNIYFTTEYKASAKKRRIWDIKKTKAVLGENICQYIPFVHAITGCDTTSRIYGIGKQIALKRVITSTSFQEAAQLFMDKEANMSDIIKAGEQSLVELYGGNIEESLDSLRYKRFTEKVLTSNSQVLVHTLPPTSDAAKFHSLRTYHQCQNWIAQRDDLDPCLWGWQILPSNSKLFPIKSTLLPAPDKLLKVIRCGCKSSCDTKRCTCRKHGLSCTIACSDCKGVNCSNCNIEGLNDDIDL